MKRLLIIADDLTGALDTGVHFAGKGIKTFVIPDSGKKPGQEYTIHDFNVLVINTESRHISQSHAYEKIKKVINDVRPVGFDFYYKKTDSTLRGNIGAEMEAMIRGLQIKQLPFIPAYPKLKRFTINGNHYIDQTLLHRTRFADDPLEPIDTSSIPELLARQTKTRIRVVPVNEVDNKQVPGLSLKEEILVFDCETDLHLEKIAEMLYRNRLINAVSGSASISNSLIKYLDLPSTIEGNFQLKGPVLVVNGSLNPVSLQQADELGASGIFTHIFRPEELIEENGAWQDQYFQRVLREANEGNHVLIRSVNSRETLEEYLDKKVPHNLRKAAYNKAADQLGKWVGDLLLTIKFKTVIIFGGDTLMAVIRAINAEGIYPIRELLSGVVVSKLPMPPEDLFLITKPGGYGNRKIFDEIFEFINGDRSC